MKKILLLLTVLPLLHSCSTIPVATEKTIDEAFSTSPSPVDQKDSQATPAEEPEQTLLEDPEAARFSISTHKKNAREFFMELVIDTDENMIVHPDVKGRITLKLKNVNIAQVMDAVQKVYGYGYKQNDMGYFVYPATLQTRIFKLNRLDLVREGQSSTQVSSGQIANSNTDRGNNNTNSSKSKDSSKTQLSSSGSWVKTQTRSVFWEEIEQALQVIISIDPKATVVVNRQTGAIVVRAKPMQLREVENFISITQNQISRQVILEAKIIEIILDDDHQAGINWQSVIRDTVKTGSILTGVGSLGTTFRDVFTLGGSLGDLGNFGDFSAYLELLETQGKTNILSSPRISTLNNQKAIIKVGQDEFFITEISTNTETSGFGNPIQNQEISFTPFFSGIALDVTPQINDRDEVTLHIHPSITRVKDQLKEFTINGEAGSLPMALNTVRESDSIIKAKNGQIVVIGGLMQESKEESKRGVAMLSQIPYIGNLFRVNTGKTQKSELVILLKPTVINNDDDWAPSLDSSKKQLKQLQNHPLWK